MNEREAGPNTCIPLSTSSKHLSTICSTVAVNFVGGSIKRVSLMRASSKFFSPSMANSNDWNSLFTSTNTHNHIKDRATAQSKNKTVIWRWKHTLQKLTALCCRKSVEQMQSCPLWTPLHSLLRLCDSERQTEADQHGYHGKVE